MVEPEVAFLELDGLLNLAEAYLTHIVTTVLAHHRADLKVIGKDISKLEAVIAPNSSDSTTDVSSRPERSEVEGPASLPLKTTQPQTTSANKFPRLSYDEAHAMLEK